MRVAVVGMPDSAERDKLVLLLHGIRRAGHTPLLVDADLFASGAVRLDGPAIRDAAPVRLPPLTGRHRTVAGLVERLSVDGITGAARSPGEAIGVDAVWPEALDIGRRLAFEGLYRQIAAAPVRSPAGSWESVLATMFKHRMRRLVGPGVRHAVVTARDDAEAARQAVSRGDVWVKAPDDTHGHGVHHLSPGEPAVPAVRKALRRTPDGELCLIEEDIRGLLADPGGRPHRADLAVTVLDGRILQATLRVQPDLAAPTNSRHGGDSLPVAVGSLPVAVREMAIGALAATHCRYGSADILGSVPGDSGFTVVDPVPPAVGEVNKMPGGRSPGFLDQVVMPLVEAVVSASR
ncbi:hypothetical protein BJY16_007177 [Actinoplanes octamycinicus]|uniref:ATP-grasp domain-containing protein n=1 Tax=Actinoplanes octamycinicus TaxID=135948 RepID=A0A7W7MB43_9ACTN|nr:hypothetical protein [Actinoplanes octamycinicus]MBB4743718.1 hypothetical protein [Actinoplanes octamycinicus]GIE61147.1 hypothetical protein Aoc01nite_65490 [Actinoplanes octamycinicus]